MLKVIELFAGIGAQAEALSRIGIDYKIIGISEIDKYAIQSYIKLHGDTKNFGDITKIEQLPEADLWTYSFPCTDISIAGKQAGFDIGSGTRSSLLWQVKRLLLKSKETGTLPKYLLMENVKAIISSKFINNFNEWLDVLNSFGYKSFYKVLNAKNYGVPQNRERVFVVSILDSNADFEFPKPVILNLKLKNMLEDVVDEKYYLSKKLVNYFMDDTNRNGYVRSKTFRPQKKNANYAFTITTRPGSRASDNFIIEPIPVAMRGRERDGDYRQVIEPKSDGIANAITTVQKDSMVIVPHLNIECVGSLKGCGLPWDNMNDSSCRVYSVDGISPTLDSMQGGHRQPKIMLYNNRRLNETLAKNEIKDADFIDAYNRKISSDISGTITTRVSDSNCTFIAEIKENNYDNIRIRKLTPRECWRLMGWSDSRINVVLDGSISNTQLYKQAGNSIVVNVLEAIFKEMFIN